jgi:general secretion pathway protein N
MAVIRLTRPLGILFASFCALAATAAADPIDESARPAPEVEGVSATEGTGVADAARLSEAPHAPDPNVKSRAGNPLWTVPVSALSSTRDRPLFSASRRPPIVAVPMAAPPPNQEAFAPPAPERPLRTLIGTIVSPKASVAMLQGSDAEAISRLRVGQENDGWQVRGISLRSIVVEKGAQSVELDIPRPSETPAESSLPNIPAAGDKASPPRQR